MPQPNSPSFEQQVADLRVYLLKFARLQLRNDAWAEDAVSETMLAAISRPQSFEQRSQLKTWLVGILKHKIIDALRQNSR
jgi:RNA polymerase sigma-70 factor (ECF subfamily)